MCGLEDGNAGRIPARAASSRRRLALVSGVRQVARHACATRKAGSPRFWYPGGRPLGWSHLASQQTGAAREVEAVAALPAWQDAISDATIYVAAGGGYFARTRTTSRHWHRVARCGIPSRSREVAATSRRSVSMAIVYWRSTARYRFATTFQSMCSRNRATYVSRSE